MSSLVIYADRDLKNFDTDCMAVETGALTALADDTTYRVQNTGHDPQGLTRTIGAHHYVYLVQLARAPASAAALRRALGAAAVLKPNEDPIGYSKETGKTGYIWSPFGAVSVSVNPAP